MSSISRWWSIATPQRIVVIASAQGGVDIEDVATANPTRSTRSTSTPAWSCSTSSAGRSRPRSVSARRRRRSRGCSKRMYRLFRDTDCLMLEVNPFIETEDGELVALDAKMSFDDNALFRQGDVVELRDFEEEDPKEVEATGPRAQLHRAGRQRRLHRERRRTRDGHDGRDRTPRWAPRELPGRRVVAPAPRRSRTRSGSC